MGRILARLDTLQQEIATLAAAPIKSEVEDAPHPLDEVFAQLKSDFDMVSQMEGGTKERLVAIQEPFNAVGRLIQESLSVPETKEEKEESALELLSRTVQALSDKVDLLTSQRKEEAPIPDQAATPAPRDRDWETERDS